MKRPPIRNPVAFAVVDTDGSVRWGLVFSSLETARIYAEHPMRRVVKIGVLCAVPKVRRKAKRGKR